MRLVHLSDLHLGKCVHGLSMLENGDHRFWIESFLKRIDSIHPDAVMIAGDVYDRSARSAEAVELLDFLVTSLARREIPVMIVAGNHDSGERLSFASELLSRSSIHIAGTLGEGGKLAHVTLSDEYGPVDFWLCPYIFPALVAARLSDDSIRDYDTAMRRLLEVQDIDRTRRNVLVAHQNVTAGGKEALLGGSESMVGAVGQMDFSVFDSFDYVALGHIHSSYPVGRDEVRYAGTPLCYHFNETRQKEKGPVVVNLRGKGEKPVIETEVISPLHRMRAVGGPYEDVQKSELEMAADGEYISVTLTDTRITPEISAYFHESYRSKGSVLMQLSSSFFKIGEADDAGERKVEKRRLEELFADFIRMREGDELEEDECRTLKSAVEFLQSSDTVEDGTIDSFVSQLLKEVRR